MVLVVVWWWWRGGGVDVWWWRGGGGVDVWWCSLIFIIQQVRFQNYLVSQQVPAGQVGRNIDKDWSEIWNTK